jgi:HlyD family secretion protein
MTKKKRILIGALILVVVGGIVAANLKREAGKVVKVQAEKVARRNLTSLVSASGRVQPKHEVKVSALRMGKVTRLAVKEGDRVAAGDLLLEIDPTTYRSSVAQLSASVEAEKARLQLAEAEEERARQDHDRIVALVASGLASDQDRTRAETDVAVSKARTEAAREAVLAANALLTSAQHDLKQVTVVSEIDGIVTRVNVEEGETAIVGTMNNPGTELLRIADLSAMEAEVDVDETDVVDVALEQKAKVTIDSYPDTSFAGVVSEIGNSAILPPTGAQDQSVDFKVVVTLTEDVPGVRPGLTAKAEITVAQRDSVLAVPIQSLTVRRESALREDESKPNGRKDAVAAEPSEDSEENDKEIEGVFVIEAGRARFRPVKTGVSSDKYFEILSGLEAGETVVTGDFKAIRELKQGQKVKITKKEMKEKKKS